MKKKNITFVFDCHGKEITKYLLMNNDFTKIYTISFVDINYYVVKNKEAKNYHKNDLQKIKNADILILQIIEKDRGFLNNFQTIKINKKVCKVIKIPHYRSSIYHYKLFNINDKFIKYKLVEENFIKKNDLLNKNNDKFLIQKIENKIKEMNNYKYDINDMNKFIQNCIKEFEKIDNLSDIKMYDFFILTYKNIRLFKGRSYPTSYFFFILTNKLLNYLGLDENNKFIDYYFAENTDQPIPFFWYKFSNFSFNNLIYGIGHIPITEIEFYFILFKTLNPNINNKNIIIKYKNQIKKILNNK